MSWVSGRAVRHSIISSGCSLTAFLVCAAFTKVKLSLQQKAGEIPFGVCLCLSRPASALVGGGGWGGDPLPRRDAISLESEHPREAGCCHDLALCSPIFHKTTGLTQSTALFPSHLPSDLASEGKALWRKGVAEFRGTLRNTKLRNPLIHVHYPAWLQQPVMPEIPLPG